MIAGVPPRDPIIWASLVVQALTYLLAEDYENALVWSHKTLQHPRAVGYWPHAIHGATLAQLGKLEEAKEEIRKALTTNPELTVSLIAKTYKTKDPDGLSPYLDGLRMAGFPE